MMIENKPIQAGADAVTPLTAAPQSELVQILTSEIDWPDEAVRDEVLEAVESVEAAKALCRRDGEFQVWAQTYLDSARWAGHDRSDAIKTELLERDAALTEARAEVIRLRQALGFAETREAVYKSGGEAVATELARSQDENTRLHAERRELRDWLEDQIHASTRDIHSECAAAVLAKLGEGSEEK